MTPGRKTTFCLIAACGLLGAAGCKPKPKAVTELQRKQAAHLDSEAQFALTMRDWARAEGLLAQAVQADPNNGHYWIALGSTRVRLGNKSRAQDAYEGALKAFQVEAQSEAGQKDPEAWLNQVQVLALLGRTDAARAVLEKTAKQFPENRAVRVFIENRQLDRLLADPSFKQVSL